MQNEFYPFVNLPLQYPYDALEPYIDERTMRLHHTRHLQTYIDNLNKLLESNPKLQAFSLEELILQTRGTSSGIRRDIHNNAGGVYNHRFFFDGLRNQPIKAPHGLLAQAIDNTFGGFQIFLEQFKEAALSVFGSGYAWLVCNRGRLKIITTANQDTPLDGGYTPLLALDVWEHAYYLKHFNRRADYVDDFFNVIDWVRAEKIYLTCIK